jgi:AcrR family transcriptional regulator
VDDQIRRAQTDRKFKRVGADVRRESLIRATIDSVSKHGHEGTSVRRIAAEAGVSPGLINHHFESLEELISLAYATLSQGWIDALSRRLEAAGAEPGPRLEAFCGACISPEGDDRKVVEAWMVFWAAISNSPRLREKQSTVWIYYREVVSRDLAALAQKYGVTNLDIERTTLGLLAIVDGLWIEKSLNPNSFTPAVAIGICLDWVEGQFLLAHRAAGQAQAGGRPRRAEDQLLLRKTGVPAGGPEP